MSKQNKAASVCQDFGRCNCLTDCSTSLERAIREADGDVLYALEIALGLKKKLKKLHYDN